MADENFDSKLLRQNRWNNLTNILNSFSPILWIFLIFFTIYAFQDQIHGFLFGRGDKILIVVIDGESNI
jgi:hypothetical protein